MRPGRRTVIDQVPCLPKYRNVPGENMIKRLVLGLILSPWICPIVFAEGGATGALQGAGQDGSRASVSGVEVRK